MQGIHEFVLAGGQKVTAGALAAFREKIPFVLAKGAELEGVEGAPHLGRQVCFLARYVEDVLDGVFSAQDIAAVPEAAFALGYLLRDVDIIPDSVPGKGFSDDSAVVRCAIQSHLGEFERYATEQKVPLPTLDP
ncbi:MAG: DUF1232 domain-containing protein [Terrimicrobiaceae bacterium]|nr:DUF1232 domain-containing protein [Terrimicrobiaceae bacterium]